MSILTILRAVFRWKKTLIALSGVLVFYTITGFFVLPMILKAQLPKRLGALLGREVILRQVRTNPFALSITLDGFLVKDRDGQAFLGWDRLYVNAKLSSVFTRTVSFSAIHLARPYGRVVLEKGGRMNFSDILERLDKAEPGTVAKSEAPREIYIGSLRVQGAQVQLLDRSLHEPFSTTLGPLSIELQGFRTQRNNRSPYAFSGRTESGETFSWTGFFSAEPLKSQGRFSLENLVLPKYHPYYRDQVAFDLTQGTATLGATYTFEWTEGHHVLQLQEGSLELLHLQFSEQGRSQPEVEVPALEARDIQADLLENNVVIGSLNLQGGRLEVARLKNGEISLVNLFTPKPRPKPEEPAKPFQLQFKELGLHEFQIAFEDQAAVRPVNVLAEHLELTLKDFSLDPKASAKLQLSTQLNGSATLSVEGTVLPFKPSMDLAVKLRNLELAPFDSYLDPATDIRVNRGLLSLEGRAQGNPDAAAFKGSVRLENFEAMDGAQQEPFIRYKALRLNGLDLHTRPAVLALQSAELVGHEYRLVIAKDGSSNVARALKLEPSPATTPLGSAIGATTPATPSDSFDVRIGQVSMTGGRLSFIDRSVEPNAVLLLSELEGINKGLSTSPGDKSSLDLKGLVGGTAPLRIQGRAMPLRHDKDTDITVKISGADLTDLSPYAGRYMGYTIRQGKLDLEAHLRIQDRKLIVEDQTRLDQLFLGDKVQSPEATHLPVKLGLALLRDRRGLIELEVPVDGSLDDPDIHYGRMVWKAILNALGKVATSPFTLLSKLFGQGADLSSATFSPGSGLLDPTEAKKLSSLVKALHERPELRLEAESTTSPEDTAVLKRAKLEALLRQVQWRSRKDRSDSSPEDEKVAPAERARWLQAAYESAFPAPKDTKPVLPPPAEMEQRLLGTLAVNPDELKSLADMRTRGVIQSLTQSEQVEASRIFEVEGGEAAKAGGSRVFFTLK